MGKVQKKTGKGRLDKYYKLAKYVLEIAPSNCKSAGVDLVPIKPIPRVVTFAADITTTHCRNLIRGELKDWKADVVLHDGAPNVGTAWIQDAYSQSELVLMSLKLAVEFLAKGGTFVTKVFRSVDYNNLIWVFNQLFGKVEATKPPSSRNVSAEIFVVCREFLAPKFIDPKFLDPRHVFKDVAATESVPDKGSSANNVQANVFQPEKKRRHRDGYADGDYTLHKTINASVFIRDIDPLVALGTANKIAFLSEEEKEWAAMDITTPEVKANCDDLKVLGKGDFKALLKWRLALREELGLDNKTKDTAELTETVEIVEEVDEEQQISDELERLNAEAAARTKRERRRANEIKTRTIQRMQLQMTAPLDIGLEQQDLSLGGQDDIFDLGGTEKGLRKKGGIERLIGDDGDLMEVSDEDEDNEESEEELDLEEEREKKLSGLEAELDGLYDAYQSRMRERDAKFKVVEARRKNAEREEWGGIKKKADSDEEASEDDDEEEGGWDRMQAAKGGISDQDSDSDSDSDSDEETPQTMKGAKRPLIKDRARASQTSKRAKLVSKLEEPKASSSKAAQVWFSQDLFSGMDKIEADEEKHEDVSMKDAQSEKDWESAASDDDDDDDFDVVPQEPDGDVDMWDAEDEDEDEAKRAKITSTVSPLTLLLELFALTSGSTELGLVTPETVTIAQQLVNRQTTKTQLINDGFNRYSLNSKDGLPSWFLDDEAKFYKPNLPITKEAVQALREKQRALDARPIKKIAEAKARKKFKAHQRLEKAMKKAEGVNATADISEREKAQQIEKLMRKGMSSGQKAKKDIKVVVAKGAHKGVKGRPKGVKGRYQMVDSRMKKELRAKKRTEKANKKR
ncbi:hypothetical protein DXG03_007110 [Asterophora parasitica]|uniref:AdoMet-dependent rRNA methyltransferase SPB1 n=1 Tax=Asterophora parasitica TaxID=117018 RepID=A0A9P7KGR8_9AGAR|nr:hypothetical protein DXG03_007110 [Asterophora parasitica]